MLVMTKITFTSYFAGVGGLDLAFERAGLTSTGMVEIDPQARAVLKHHRPVTPLHDDICTLHADTFDFADVLVGGFPCQDVSIAGKQGGLEAARSGLFFEYTRLIGEIREASAGLFPRFAVFENVVNLLSSKAGKDFSIVLDTLFKKGAREIAWRVLDTRLVGIPQRRRRIAIVVDFGGEQASSALELPEQPFQAKDWRDVRMKRAGVLKADGRYWTEHLPEHMGEALTGDLADFLETQVDEKYRVSPKACRGILNRAEKRAKALPAVLDAALRYQAGLTDLDVVEAPLTALHLTQDPIFSAAYTPTISCGSSEGQAVVGVLQEVGSGPLAVDFRNGATSAQTVMRSTGRGGFEDTQDTGPLTASLSKYTDCDVVVSIFAKQAIGEYADKETTSTQTARQFKEPTDLIVSECKFPQKYVIRRLTPLECERLQNFPDHYTAVLWKGKVMPDSARYRFMGNAVTVRKFERIAENLAKILLAEKQSQEAAD